jgi:hypothetical protein
MLCNHSFNRHLSSAAKAILSSNTLLQFLHLDNFGRKDPLKHKLRNAITLFDLEVLLAEVEEQDPDLAAVVCVDDAGASGNRVLGCETGARGYASVCFSLALTHLYPHTLPFLFLYSLW